MLDQRTIDIVKSTSSVLKLHGEDLTRHFYKRMFSHNPEVAPFFNPTNQAEGTQQRALAGAICAYAANIDNLGALSGAVELIAQKHASLMIKPEQYPIVGENLLASIREVLGDGATDDVINAWDEAYSVLTGILTERENQIYLSNAEKTGGWEGFRNFKVEKKEIESNIITSFYLKPEDGGALPDYLPGQYITVRMPWLDNSTTMRNYSLSDVPGTGYFRISVKREVGPKADIPSGYVSNKLHDDIKIGDIIEVGPPCGEFFVKSKDDDHCPLVLLAAGVGITPIYSILKSSIESMPEREIIFVHASLNENVQPFKDAIDSLSEKHAKLKIHYRYSEAETKGAKRKGNCSTGFVDADFIESLVPDHHADYYFCGPKPFMANLYRTLLKWNVPEDQIHFEFFGPKEELEGSAQA